VGELIVQLAAVEHQYSTTGKMMLRPTAHHLVKLGYLEISTSKYQLILSSCLLDVEEANLACSIVENF
jgi:hypothetical protein